MEPALQRRVQRYGWDKAANHYESSWQKQLQPAQDKLMQFANVQAGEKVIDIACGTGLVTFRVAEKTGEKGFVLGTDISGKMVELASSSKLRASKRRPACRSTIARRTKATILSSVSFAVRDSMEDCKVERAKSKRPCR